MRDWPIHWQNSCAVLLTTAATARAVYHLLGYALGRSRQPLSIALLQICVQRVMRDCLVGTSVNEEFGV